MARGSIGKSPPRGLLRLAARMPIWLYRLGLGWLLGGRFLMLTHIGRKSGLPRQVVLEVVHYDRDNHTFIVASGWGEQSNWFQNVLKTPQVVVQSGRRRCEAMAERLSLDEAAAALAGYGRRHPTALNRLAKFMTGEPFEGGSDTAYRHLAEAVPLVAFHCK
jgi:deazaflavin-dependent oxidoreductase (nitroreductase family)